MRLLSRDDDGIFHVTDNIINEIPAYTILSHTWGESSEEVTFKDLQDGTGHEKAGYDKLIFCAEEVLRNDLKYFWIDTCCIDKTSSAEVSEAINSMFAWYRNAACCYVFLSDVTLGGDQNRSETPAVSKNAAFRQSRWFTRGWTLQELLAPTSVQFFSQDAICLGDKNTLQKDIHEITGISLSALMSQSFKSFDVEERFGWAQTRTTTRQEDWAYSLQGIFDVYMPPLYGEGRENATNRLRISIVSKDLQSFVDVVRGRCQQSRDQSQGAFEKLQAAETALSALKHDLRHFIGTLSLMMYGSAALLGQMLVKQTEHFDKLQEIIDSERALLSDLQRGEEANQEVMEQLKSAEVAIELPNQGAHDFNAVMIHHPSTRWDDIRLIDAIVPVESFRGPYREAGQRREPAETDIAQLQNEENARLRQNVDECQEEIRQLRIKMRLASEQSQQNLNRVEAKLASYLAAKKEAERVRRESQYTTVWQQIWAWISWLLLSGGQGD